MSTRTLPLISWSVSVCTGSWSQTEPDVGSWGSTLAQPADASISPSVTAERRGKEACTVTCFRFVSVGSAQRRAVEGQPAIAVYAKICAVCVPVHVGGVLVVAAEKWPDRNEVEQRHITFRVRGQVVVLDDDE